MADEQKRYDKQTDSYTTGHSWDGIEELENPPPKWWLIVFVVCIIFAAGYAVLFPSVPGHDDFYKGTLGWTSETHLKEQLDELHALRSSYTEKLSLSDPAGILANPELKEIAVAGGKALFNENCAACHGKGGGGRPGGFPVLADDDWLWGGSIENVYQTIRRGVRIDEEGRQSRMPAFGGSLPEDDILLLASYVRSFSGLEPAPAGEPGKKAGKLFEENCASCHSADGKHGGGGREFGAPNLTDKVWLYSSEKDKIASQIRAPKHGAMPAWELRLPQDAVKMLAVYVWSLGGGEASVPPKAAAVPAKPAVPAK